MFMGMWVLLKRDGRPVRHLNYHTYDDQTALPAPRTGAHLEMSVWISPI
jgi:hypothetical protein